MRLWMTNGILRMIHSDQGSMDSEILNLGVVLQ